ncbi:hypothetical protein BDP27DRAFT_1148885, partial [Rhodocollybia butyracea]
AAKKRYKPVAQRVKPVPTTLPEDFRILLISHPIPSKSPSLKSYSTSVFPTGRYTAKRMSFIDNSLDKSFLWPEE